MINYQNKPLAEHSLWDLGLIKASFKEAEAKREDASKHPKFKKMEFPPPNPAFLELKLAVEEEIRKRQNANS